MKLLKTIFFYLFFACLVQAQVTEGGWYQTDDTSCLIYIADEGLTSVSWIGACKDGYAHGHGKMTAWDEDVLVYEYEGNITEGRMSGKGLFNIAGSGVYEGDFDAGEMHGFGKLSTEILVYEGDFVDGMFHGKGRLSFANGDEYIGDFRFGAEDGYGVFVFAGGTIYEGDWKDGQPHGSGIQKFANGDVYEGSYYDGEWYGTGKLIIKGEYIYEGAFEDGMPHGEGVMIPERGNKAVGEFRYGELFNGEIFDAATDEKLGVVVDGVAKRIDK